MSNTPPIRQEDLGRAARNLPNFLYPGGGNLDFPSHLVAIDQSNALGAYRANVDLSGGSQGRGATFLGEVVASGRIEARPSSYTADDEGSLMYRMRNDSAKTRDMNQSLDGDYKGLDNAAALNMTLRNGDYSNGYPSDSALRNFQNTTDQRSPFSAYGCIQSSHPSLNPRMPGLQQFIPQTSMIAHNPFTSPYMLSSLLQRSSSYLEHPIRDVPPYGIDRRTHLSYPARGHIGLGQSGSSFSSLQDHRKAEVERGVYGKFSTTPYGSSQRDLHKKAIETDAFLGSRFTSRHDLYPYVHSTSSRPTDLGGNKYPATDTYAHSSALSQNGIKVASSPVIDLTSSKSPDARPNSESRSDFASSRSAPPPGARDSRSTPKENGGHRQGDTLKTWNPSRIGRPSVGAYPGASMSPFSGFPGISAVHPISLTGHYNPTVHDTTFNDLTRAKTVDSALMPGAAQWRHSTRLHTPSPRQYGIADSTKKNGSPSLQFKSKAVPQGVPSDLTFNYPEGSGSKADKLSGSKHLGNGMLSPKSQLWSKKDESKLSPYENLIIDSARDGKPCTSYGKFDSVSYVQPRYQQNYSRPPAFNSHARLNPPPEYIAPQHPPSEIHDSPGKAAELSRNSVIQSVPKLLEQLEDSKLRLPDKPSESICDFTSSASNALSIRTTDVSTETTETKELPSSENWQEMDDKTMALGTPVISKVGVKRKSSKTKDGEQRPKRKYTKRSDVWKKKGLQHVGDAEHKQQPQSEEKSANEEQVSTCEPPPKAAEDRKIQRAEPTPVSVKKSARPQRRSGGADMDEEYLYGWFTEEEVENDDSSDEDYNCTTKFMKSRNKGVAKTLRQRRRLSSWRFDFGEISRSRETSRDEECSDYSESSLLSSHWKENTLRRERRKLGLRNNGDELMTGKPEEDEGKKDTSCHPQEEGEPLRTDPPSVLCDKTGNLLESKNLKQDDLPSVETEPIIRKKRKYTRRLDEDGRPIKRARKALKSVEHIPKKKSKHCKMPEKHFKRKKDGTFAENSIDFVESGENENIKGASNSGSNIGSDTADTARPEAEDKARPTGTAAFDKSQRKETETPSKGAQKEGLTATPKIKKKPGRKPGWRKYPQGEAPGSSGNLKTILKKKYKKPKGDGLCRFGMRKRGKRPKFRFNATPAALRIEDTAETLVKSETLVNIQNASTKPKRKYNMASRAEKKRQRLLGLGIMPASKAKTSATCSGPHKKAIVHEISEELRSQEYEYDFKGVFSHREDHEDQNSREASSSMELKTPDDGTEQFTQTQSKPQTPAPSLGTLGGTPFPSHLKKLCCNSAIGETPLHKAARMCYVENLQYYLESGTNLNQSDNAGYTALHEACVHNHLEVASLLLQYTADVNKYAVDGTRPLHDAVEYDHLEMVRLMLACGADPMLSKFSGRSIPNMIRSEGMRKFVEAHLGELKEIEDCLVKNKDLEWKFPCSAVLDESQPHYYNTLDFAPDEEELSLEFELYDDEPIATYLLQPDEESERADFCLLDDYMKAIDRRRERVKSNIRVVTMPSERFRTQIRDSKLQSLQFESSRHKPDLSTEFVELVAVDDDMKKTVGAETIRMPLFEKAAPTKDYDHHAPLLGPEIQDDKARLDESVDSTRNNAADGEAELPFVGDSGLKTNVDSSSPADSRLNGGEIKATANSPIAQRYASEKIQELSSCQNGAPALDGKLADANSSMLQSADVGEVR